MQLVTYAICVSVWCNVTFLIKQNIKYTAHKGVSLKTKLTVYFHLEFIAGEVSYDKKNWEYNKFSLQEA